MADATLKHTTDVMRFFKQDAKTNVLTFTGTKLVARVPARYQVYGYLTVTDVVTTIGVMDLLINEQWNAHLHLIGVIEMRPSAVASVVIDGLEYLELTFYNGDQFLTNTTIVKNSALIYALYTEFIDRGKMICTMGYEDLIWLFDSAKEMADASLPVDHAIFEVIYAHLARDAQDRFTPYRHTDMQGDFVFIPLRDVAFAPDSTSARLMGNYFSDSLLASLLTESGERRNFEDLLRGIPTEKAERQS